MRGRKPIQRQECDIPTVTKALEVLSCIRSTKEEEAVKSIAELEQEIVNSLEILGEERTSKIFMNCSWFSEDEEYGDC